MTLKPDQDWWKTLFDETYLVTDARSVCNDEITRQEVDVICDVVPMQQDQRILDLCGGHGRHAIELCARGFNRCCVYDYSDALAETEPNVAINVVLLRDGAELIVTLTPTTRE